MDDQPKPPTASPPNLRAALDDLPIFPLPKAVLFPGARLPLHIFEPRYRQMTRDALASHKTLAIAHLLDERPAFADGQPAIALVAGVGTIIDWHELPDGRYNLLLEGQGRVRLDEFPYIPPYRRARGVWLDDTEKAVSATDIAALTAVARAFAGLVQSREPNFQFRVPAQAPPGHVADLCAHHLMLDATERQSALEALDVGERVRKVADALAVQLAVLRQSRETVN